VSSVSILW